MAAQDLTARLQKAVLGQYTISRELGGGGMSRVYRATDDLHGRDVVLKILPPDLAAGVSVARFKREIDVAARLQHPHIVPLLATGYADGLPWFAMPYLGGASLRERIGVGHHMPVADAIHTLREMASALAYSHGKGVVHRDIKPENVLFSGDVAMIADFGVAKALIDAGGAQGDGTAQKLTTKRIALGTPQYMSPEQASGDPLVDTRADIYAWGVVAYELLSGTAPFEGRSLIAQMAAHAREAPEALSARNPALPIELTALIMQCLEKLPQHRPQRAEQLVATLDGVLARSVQETGAMPVAAEPLARPHASHSGLFSTRFFSVAGVLLIVMVVLAVMRVLR